MATILVVDDRPENREYMVTLLRYRQHDLLEAADGAEALAITRSRHPDLIIADILMPTMDGFELVRQVRGDPAIAQTPVIFWTAHYHEREALSLARSCGVSRVVTKPSEPETILNAVEATLGPSLPPAPHRPVEEYDREHLRLITDKLSQKVDALKATNERQAALVDLNLQLASEQDLNRLLQNFGHAARRIIGARFSVVGILDDSRTRFQHVFTSGLDARAAAALGSPAPDAPALKTILGMGRCIRLHNPGFGSVKLGLPQSHPLVRSWLGAPIASPTRVYGYVGLGDRIGLEEFTPEDERLAGILASQVGRIYQNGILYSELMNHAADLERKLAVYARSETALGETRRHRSLMQKNVSAVGGEGLGSMLQVWAEALVPHLDLAFARIWTINKPETFLELKASASPHNRVDATESCVPFGESEIGRIARERTQVLTNDVATDADFDDKEWAKRDGIVAFAGQPLVVEDRLVGVVGIYACHPFNAATAQTMGAVADEIALAIERAQDKAIMCEREEHIGILIDSMGTAIWGTDLQGLCTFANPALARLLGYASPDEVVGRNMQDFIHDPSENGPPHPPGLCKIMTEILHGQDSHGYGEIAWRADNSRFPIEYWAHPVCHDGKVAGGVVALSNITEGKDAIAEVSRLHIQLAQAGKPDNVDRFVGDVAHDLNNLLSAINGYVMLIGEKLSAGHPVQESVTEIRKAGGHAAQLTRQLALVSRITAPWTRPVNVNSVILEARTILGTVLGGDIGLELNLDPSLGSIVADPEQLHRVLLNLAINARDAMPDGGRLLIETRNIAVDDDAMERGVEAAPGPYIQVQFIDTGVGITPEVMPHLFEPFFTTKKSRGEAGLGLSIVQAIVKSSGGSISVCSEPGKGATFTVNIPQLYIWDTLRETTLHLQGT